MFSLFLKNKFSLKGFLVKFAACVIILALFIYIIYSILFGIRFKYENIDIYDHCQFDIRLDSPCKEIYNNIIGKQGFIEADLKCVNVGGDLLYKGQYGVTSSLNIDAQDFTSLFKIFPSKLFVVIEESLLARRDGVFLSFSLAQSMGIRTGELVSVTGRDKIVVGIYEDAVTNVLHFDSILLVDDTLLTQLPGVGSHFYDEVFIKVSDRETAQAYFDKSYFKHLGYIELLIGEGSDQSYRKQYGEDWILKAIQAAEGKENIVKPYRQNAFLPKAALKAYAKNDYQLHYNLNQDIAYSVISTLAIFSVCILESYRHAKESQQKIAILRMLGCRRGRIRIFYFTRSFFIQTVLMLLGVVYVRLLTGKRIYISTVLTLQWVLFFELVILIAAFLSTAISMKKLSDKALLSSLNEEGSVD